jgi:hypothetical protein
MEYILECGVLKVVHVNIMVTCGKPADAPSPRRAPLGITYTPIRVAPEGEIASYVEGG